jgi:hypothetical protein
VVTGAVDMGDDTGTVAVMSSSVDLSLQPNQPGVRHVVVAMSVVVVVVFFFFVVVDVVVESVVVVVVPSRHPHHPGVLQVDVLVAFDVVVLCLDVVVDSV